jgi:hypothetical protein
MIAESETPEELACAMTLLESEGERACKYNSQLGKCNMSLCRQHSQGCCMLGMTEYLKAQCDSTATLTGSEQNVSRWSHIKNLPIGGAFEVILKDGKTVVFEKVHNKEGVSFFVLRDLWSSKHPMNVKETNSGGFADSVMNWWLKNKVLSLLPDDLVSKILPRKITQHINGEEFSDMCKLWIPSAIEVFGKEDWSEETLAIEPNDEQFEFFKNEGHHIKKFDDYAYGWWLRSPNVHYTYYFWDVHANGQRNHYNANGNLGVAFGFCI